MIRPFSIRPWMGTALAVVVVGCGGASAPPASPSGGGEPARRGGTYDDAATQMALNRAVRQAGECAKIDTDGPFGDYTVQVVVSAKGKLADAQLPAALANAPIGKCVKNAFEQEVVPPWDGPDKNVEAKISLVKPRQAAKPKKTGPARPVRQGQTVVEEPSDAPSDGQ